MQATYPINTDARRSSIANVLEEFLLVPETIYKMKIMHLIITKQ